jgi:hypothetical protein
MISHRSQQNQPEMPTITPTTTRACRPSCKYGTRTQRRHREGRTCRRARGTGAGGGGGGGCALAQTPHMHRECECTRIAGGRTSNTSQQMQQPRRSRDGAADLGRASRSSPPCTLEPLELPPRFARVVPVDSSVSFADTAWSASARRCICCCAVCVAVLESAECCTPARAQARLRRSNLAPLTCCCFRGDALLLGFFELKRLTENTHTLCTTAPLLTK